MLTIYWKCWFKHQWKRLRSFQEEYNTYAVLVGTFQCERCKVVNCRYVILK